MATTSEETGRHIALVDIRVPDNVRELDPEHVKALAGSIGLQDMLVPVVVRNDGDGFELVAGFHRVAAASGVDPTEEFFADEPAHDEFKVSDAPCGRLDCVHSLRTRDTLGGHGWIVRSCADSNVDPAVEGLESVIADCSRHAEDQDLSLARAAANRRHLALNAS
jgi:ParB-like nuclease domain